MVIRSEVQVLWERPTLVSDVGPRLSAIKRALRSGNLREQWALVYVLTKSQVRTLLSATARRGQS